MQRQKTILLISAVILLLTGCGKSVAEVTTIAIQKNGEIEHTMIETFEEDSVDAFRNMLTAKVEEYNSGVSGDAIEVKGVEEQDGVIKVEMAYPSAADFDSFMNMDVVAVDPALQAPFFYGTVEEAFTEGYDLDTILYGVENDNLLRGKDDILLMGQNRIVIYDNQMNLGAAVQISVPKTVLYTTENVKIVGKKLVEVSDTDGLAYILLEG